MKKSGIRKILLIHLFYFLAFVAFINFFHTDSILDNQQNCPACQFQRSNIALAFILFLFLITFSCLRLLVSSEFFPDFFISSFHKHSRAPPPQFS
jgi:hypothetical protein